MELRAAWRRPTGAERHQDVINSARKGEGPLAYIAKGFGLSATTLKLCDPPPSVSNPEPAASVEPAKIRELKKLNRLLEQKNEMLRRSAAYLAREDINPK